MIHFLAATAAAADWYVCAAGPDCRPSIHDAVDVAAAGDTIYVSAGTWRENFAIDKDLTIVGPPEGNVLVRSAPEAGETPVIAITGGVVNLGQLVISGVDGRALEVTDAVVTLTDVTASSDALAEEGGVVRAERSTFGCDGGRLGPGRATYGGVLWAADTNLTVGCLVSGGEALFDGGGIYVVDGDGVPDAASLGTGAVIRDSVAGRRGGGLFTSAGVSVEASSLHVLDNRAVDGGGIYALGPVTSHWSIVSGNIATNDDGFNEGGSGGGLYAAGATVSLYGDTFVSNRAEFGGGGIHVSGTALSVTRVDIASNEAAWGAAIGALFDSDVTVSQSRIAGNSILESGGGSVNVNSGTLDVGRSALCDNVGGAAVRVNPGERASVHNSVFARNEGYATVDLAAVDEVEIVHDHVIGNRATWVVELAATNGVVADTFLGWNEAEILVDRYDGAHEVAVHHLGGWENVATDSVEDHEGSVTADPHLRIATIADFVCGSRDYIDDVSGASPTWYSPLRDAGSDLDLDGSAADIGAWGGSGTLEIRDGDEDGYDDRYDCDDYEPAVAPEVVDEPYDGVDADCDWRSDYDADHDGADDAPYGPDCDGADPTSHPGATDLPNDFVDQDCSGDAALDVDHDGWSYAEAGLGDCDDSNPRTHPGALELPGDDEDSDCDGYADPTDSVASAGCATGAPGEAGWLAPALSLAISAGRCRRRRR